MISIDDFGDSRSDEEVQTHVFVEIANQLDKINLHLEKMIRVSASEKILDCALKGKISNDRAYELIKKLLD